MVAAALWLARGIAASDEVPFDKVPTAIKKAADAVAPKTKWLNAFQETEEGQVTYELDGKDAQDRDVNVVLTAQGKVTAVELQIPLKEVPQPVRTVVMAKLPKFKPATAFNIRRGTDLARSEPNERVFAVDGTIENDFEVSIQVTPDGKIASLERQIDVAEIPTVVLASVTKQLSLFEASVAYEFSEGETVTRYLLEGVRKTTAGEVEVSINASADGKDVTVAQP